MGVSSFMYFSLPMCFFFRSGHKTKKYLKKEKIMDGRLEKMEKDYAEEGVAKLQQAQDLASKGETKKAIETILMPFEKDTRMAGDMATTSKVLVCIVELCFKAQMWQFLNDSMTVLAKKRSLIKASIGKMVKRAYDYVEETPSLEIKIKLIECLRDITDGKIYVELERASWVGVGLSIYE